MAKSVFTIRYRTLQRLLVDARNSQGLSQAELAQRLGRVQTFVSKYERGERRLDVVELIDVVHALGLDLLKVLTEIQSTDGK